MLRLGNQKVKVPVILLFSLPKLGDRIECWIDGHNMVATRRKLLCYNANWEFGSPTSTIFFLPSP